MVDARLFILFYALVCFAEQADAKIVRPCLLTDYKCISDNLAMNSNCDTTVWGSLPDSYYIASFKFVTPYFNSTYIDKELYMRNINSCFVTEFFFNSATGRVVLAFDCPNLELESERTYIQHKTYKEDGYFYYHIKALYPLIRITINLSPSKLDLCTANFFADVVTLPILFIDPKDKPTANTLTRDLTLLNIYERENFQARARQIALILVGANICHYECTPQ